MIIGEKINQYQHHEQEDDSYDYLFKRKGGASGPGRQKKAERKSRKGGRRSGQPAGPRLDKRSAGAYKNRLILQNFGLFNKKKNQRKAEAAAQDALATPEGSILPDAPTLDDNTQEQEINAAPDTRADAIPPDNPDTGSAADGEDDSSYDETPGTSKTETKSPSKKNETKDSGAGAWIGWGFLGLTVLVIGYTMYRLDKMEAQLPHNNDLHPNH